MPYTMMHFIKNSNLLKGAVFSILMFVMIASPFSLSLGSVELNSAHAAACDDIVANGADFKLSNGMVACKGPDGKLYVFDQLSPGDIVQVNEQGFVLDANGNPTTRTAAEATGSAPVTIRIIVVITETEGVVVMKTSKEVAIAIAMYSGAIIVMPALLKSSCNPLSRPEK